MKNSATLPFLGQGPRFGQVLWKKGGYFEYLGIAKQTLPGKVTPTVEEFNCPVSTLSGHQKDGRLICLFPASSSIFLG
jgi:hypothetical protein